MPRTLRCFLLLIVLGAAVGCRSECGERRHLFPRLHERLNLDGNHNDANEARRSGLGKNDCHDGTPVSRNGTGFGGETMSYPGPGTIIYPSGQPSPANNPRSDELPQPGFISPPGVPYAPNRQIDSSKSMPKPGGTMTGDPKK